MSTERTTENARQPITETVLQRLRGTASLSAAEEVLERAGDRVGGNFSAAEAVAAVRAERDSR